MKVSVRKFLPLWIVVLLFSSPAFSAGPWNYARQLPDKDSGVKLGLVRGLYLDFTKQRYYVVDAQNGQLVSFDKDGKFLAAFNAGGELKIPVSLARTTSGGLWVVDRADNKLLQINPRLQKVQRFSIKYPDGGTVFPEKVAIDSRDRLFVLDKLRGSILQLDDNLQVVRSYRGDDQYRGFVDFKLKGETLWALDGLSQSVYSFRVADGTVIKRAGLTGLQFPVSLEIDSAGQLYVLDRHAGKVVVFDPNGNVRFDFLGKGKRYGQLWFAEELIFDWQDNLCVVDEGNGRVDILTR